MRFSKRFLKISSSNFQRIISLHIEMRKVDAQVPIKFVKIGHIILGHLKVRIILAVKGTFVLTDIVRQ